MAHRPGACHTGGYILWYHLAMSKPPKDSRREYTETEQSHSFIARRIEAFADRSREPGDAVTWAVVLGALICTLLMICYAVADQPRIALVAGLVTIIWIIVVSRYGRVNVAAILWGGSTSDASTPPHAPIIFLATNILAIAAAVSVIVDAATGLHFGWYGAALAVAVVTHGIIAVRSWQPRN